MKFSLFALTGTVLVMSFFMFVNTSCKKDQDVFPGNLNIPDSILTSIVNDTLCMDFYLALKQLPYLQQATPITNPTNVGTPVTEESGNYLCTMQTVKWSPEYDEMYLLDPKSEAIYPTGLVDANSVPIGAYTPITNVERAPAKISISLLTKPGDKPYELVQDPSLSSVRDATNILLHRVAEGSTPAFINFDIQEIRAREEAELGIQANFKGWGAKVSSSYSFETEQEMSRFLVKFYQKYYTIDMDLPKTPCSMFKDGQLPQIENFNGTSPVYISSVTYGRMVYFMVESSSSSETMKAALSASFHKFKTGGDVNISYEHKQALEQSHISALVVGGNADGAVQAVNGVNGLLEFLTADGDFSATSPGAPIAYTMRYLKDNSVARIVLNSEYTIRNCEEKGEERILLPSTSVQPYDGCPELSHGDNEFGGTGVKVEGSISLKISGDKKSIIATINYLFDEPMDDQNFDDTQAKIKNQEIIAYELSDSDKNNYYISDILSDKTSEVDFTQPNIAGNHHPPFSGNFINDIIIQADGAGDDLPCVGYTEDPDGRAFVRMYFKNLKVFVKKL